jgi:hypothetical protein
VNQAGDLIHRLAQALPQLEASERHERAEQRPDREALSLGGLWLDLAWLNPNASDLSAQYAILDDRARPFYEHRLAA